MAEGELSICVVYALPDRQEIVRLRVPNGTSVEQAVALSQLPRRFPAIAGAPLHCAIFGRAVALSQVLHDGDRVEVLRPLLIDPKEQRRRAAAQSQQDAAKRMRRS
jgi:putative ubiquitin-RnfH superfamily antitoxin RatB of RatAB toxin-antitoxin module